MQREPGIKWLYLDLNSYFATRAPSPARKARCCRSNANVQGERFWYWLHGYDFESPESSSKMIGHSRVLDPSLRSAEKTHLITRRLLIKATYRLRRKEYFARTMTLNTRNVDGHKWSKEIHIPPAQDPFTFLFHLNSL